MMGSSDYAIEFLLAPHRAARMDERMTAIEQAAFAHRTGRRVKNIAAKKRWYFLFF
jgi:hypothetical protein